MIIFHREIKEIRDQMERGVSWEMRDPKYVYTTIKYLQTLISILCVYLFQGINGTKGDLGDKGDKGVDGQKGFKVNPANMLLGIVFIVEFIYFSGYKRRDG